MTAPEVLSMTATVRCECGEETEFDGIEDGWQHIYPCGCGRYVSVQIDSIVQYDGRHQWSDRHICDFDMGEGDNCLLDAGHTGKHS